MKSMVCSMEEIIDPRKVIINGYFWGLDDEHFDNLFKAFYSGIKEMLEDLCIYKWWKGAHVLKNPDDSLQALQVKDGKFDKFVMMGYVKSPYISNTKEMNQAFKGTVADLSRVNLYDYIYAATIKELLLEYKEDPIQLKKGIIKLFDMEGKNGRCNGMRRCFIQMLKLYFPLSIWDLQD